MAGLQPPEIAAPSLSSSPAPRRRLQPHAAWGSEHGNSNEGLATAALKSLYENFDLSLRLPPQLVSLRQALHPVPMGM